MLGWVYTPPLNIKPKLNLPMKISNLNHEIDIKSRGNIITLL